MNRICKIMLVAMLAIVCFSCKKDPIDVNSGQIIVTEREVPQLSNDNDTISAVFQGRYSYSGKIQKLYLQIGLKSDLSDAIPYDAEISGLGFTVKGVDNLEVDTVYYYRYVVRRHSNEFGEDLDWRDSIRNLSTRGVWPKVATGTVNSIKRTSAVCGGIVIDEEGQTKTECGICWSKFGKPTIEDNYVRYPILCLGEYRIQMNYLEPATTYHVRAYARNEIGISYAYETISFSTSDFSVVTEDPYDIEGNKVSVRGTIYLDFEGSVNVDKRGFCLGSTPQTENPLAFTGNMSINAPDSASLGAKLYLDYETTYYVRAYAVDPRTGDTAFGEVKSFTTLLAPPVGTIDGLFSVSEHEQVYFSKGNLQYQAFTNTWRFADNQWDFVGGFDDNDGNTYGNVVGSSNNEIDSCYAGWIDLFNWGTSGYNHGAVCYQPWGISNDYENDYKAYGNSSYNLFDQSGQADWGYNAISNGGNIENKWRTLTKEEWEYLFKTRETVSGIRYAKAQVNGVNGIILLPDNWIANSSCNLQEYNTPNASFTSNMISLSSWNSYYSYKGVVFLPEAGQRDYKNQYALAEYPRNSCYWASSMYSSNISDGFAYCIDFGDSNFDYKSTNLRCKGFSVRLVYSGK